MFGSKKSLAYGTYYDSSASGLAKPKMKFIVIGLIVAAVIGAILLFLNLSGGGGKSDLTLLAVRENSLQQLMADSQVRIRNPDLSTINSSATLLLTSDVSTLLGDLTRVYGIKKLPEDMVKREADTNGDKLKEAELLNKFDATYVKVVREKLASLLSLAEKTRSTVGSKTTRTSLEAVKINLTTIDTQLKQLSL